MCIEEDVDPLHATFDQAAVGIAHVAENGQLIRVNQTLADIIGYSREELLHMTFQQFTFPEDLPKDLEGVHHLLSGKSDTYKMEKRYIRRDGSVVWVELTVSIVRRPGEPSYFISIVNDIDRRKKAEDSLRRERELAQLERDGFFDLALDLMAITGQESRFLRVNPAFCQVLGYTSEELIGRSAYEFVHPDDHEMTRAHRVRFMEGPSDELPPLEHRIVAKDGSVKWLSWMGRRIPELEFNYITARDITERKASEAEAQRQQALRATNSKLQTIGMMATNMAHEINNPLTIIYGEACMLRKLSEQGDVERGQLNRTATNILKMSERIVSIIKGLRALASDGTSEPMRCVTLRQIFDDTLPFCRTKIAAKNIELRVDDSSLDTTVYGRAVQLSQALLNLLTNAYDAVSDLEAAGLIHISTRVTPERVQIRVCDNGPGIDPSLRQTLFQPFVTSKSAGQGLGLGLNISKIMIEANYGELFLDETEAQTTFVISLPGVTA
jgi:PAS domain S-box-containing protein